MSETIIRKPPTKDYPGRKWGYRDERALDSLERTRKYIIKLLSNPSIWHTFNKVQADYFLTLLQFEHDFKLGYINNWQEFFTGEVIAEADRHKKADGNAYYEKARNYLDIIYQHEEE